LAVITGCRSGSDSTLGPIFRRVVRAAMAASMLGVSSSGFAPTSMM
jgi:hypothetical protein